MSSAFDTLKLNGLTFRLTPISIRELFFLQECPCRIYGLEKTSIYTILLHKHAQLDKFVLRDLLQRGHSKVFVSHEDRERIIELQQHNLRIITRSLSVGDPIERGKKQLGLLSLNMAYLYENTTNDDYLNLQYQSAKNLANFLINNPQIHERLYVEYAKQKYHYIFSQPLISSIFLLGILKQSHLFNQKDMETLFITSYFKDIGMSAIPTEHYDQKELSHEEKLILARHAKNSVNILAGRLNLGRNYLNIIENHHSFSLLTKELSSTSNGDEMALGFETMIISTTDIIAAMITGRPYQEPTSLFDALDLVKLLIADQYPQEFKLIVAYFKSFFTKTARL